MKSCRYVAVLPAFQPILSLSPLSYAFFATSITRPAALLQMTSQPEELLSIDHYVKKTFYKTASLMANSCKAVAILGGQPREDCQLAWEYGRHLGLAFQVRHA